MSQPEAWAMPSEGPQIVRTGALDMQVCVPIEWSDDEIVSFANLENPAGTENGWHIRTDPELLAGCPVRNPCGIYHATKAHVTLDC